MKRALCIWLPNWPLQRLAAARAELSERAVVLYELHPSGGAKVVAYCPRLAAAAAAWWENDSRHGGIRPGMPLAEATALSLLSLSSERAAAKGGTLREKNQEAKDQEENPSAPLHLEPIDPAADRLALEALAEWCHRFSPTVGLEETAAPESLLLDVTGLGRLFGGEQALARRIVRALGKRGLTARVALADTPGAAWAVAHFAELRVGAAAGMSGDAILSAVGIPRIVPTGQTPAALAPLPPAALRLPAETCALLADLGVRRIGELAALPRETLPARFGPQVLERLDQATGQAPEAIAARAVPPEWLFEWLFEHPTGRRETIEWVLGQLVARACEALARGGRGLLRLECCLLFDSRSPERFVVGLFRPSASRRHVDELVRLKLERLRFREPLTAIRLRVLAIDRLEFRQGELFAGERSRESPRELAALVDRLSNRLGPHAVLRPWLLAGAQVEFACQYRPLATLAGSRERTVNRGPTPAAGVDDRGRSQKGRSPKGRLRRGSAGPGQSGDRPLHVEPEPRPLAVLSVVPDGPPVKFRFAGRDQRITRTWGPERIETGWWRGGCVRRDYYQVETTRGERYWLFRDLDTGRWFLHGMFT